MDVLNNLYRKLLDNVLRSEGKLKDDSLLWTLMSMSEKKRKALIDESQIEVINFSESEHEAIKDSAYITLDENLSGVSVFSLTALGIWKMDKKEKDLSEGNLIESIQDKFFTFTTTKKPLDDKDKLALLSLIGARCFSSRVKMDISVDEYLKGWEDVFCACFEILKTTNSFRARYSSPDELLEKRGKSHPVRYLMRHRNNLAMKTYNIFKNPGGSSGYQYWIEIFNKESFSEEKLVKLFKLIFNNKLEYEQFKYVASELEKVANEKVKYLRSNFDFINYEYDKKISHCIRPLVF